MTILKRIEALRYKIGEADTSNALLMANLLGESVDLMNAMAHDIETLKHMPPESELFDPVGCRQKTCSYYTHYLIYYKPALQGEKLEHFAYHAAETKCNEVQTALLKWQDEHPDAKHEPESLVRQCDFWERKVAA